MDNPEKLAILCTQDTRRRQKTKNKKQKNPHNYIQANTCNVNKT